jgi:hypothetical protein
VTRRIVATRIKRHHAASLRGCLVVSPRTRFSTRRRSRYLTSFQYSFLSRYASSVKNNRNAITR